MRVIFAGTPEVALPTLEALHSSPHQVVAVLTREDAPVGRKRIMTPSPVAAWADQQQIPIVRANRISDSVTDALRAFDADLGVVVAYGGLLPQPALAALPLGWINLHFSALPQWRGAAPVQWQLISGANSVSTSVFQLVAELDAGDILSVVDQSVYPWETADDLLKRLAELGAQQVLGVVNDLAIGDARAQPQRGVASFAPKLSRADGLLNPWQAAHDVFSRFRGVTTEPGAWLSFRGESLKISGMSDVPEAPQLAAGQLAMAGKSVWLGTATHALRLDTVQPAGRSVMQAVDWFRGVQDPESACIDVV